MLKIPLLIVFKVETDAKGFGMNEVEYTYNTIAFDTDHGISETNISRARENDLNSVYNLNIWGDNIIKLKTNTDAVPLVSKTQITIDYPTRAQRTDIKKATAYCKQIIDAYKKGYAFVKLGKYEDETKFFQFQKLTELRPTNNPTPPPPAPARRLPTTTTLPFTREQLEELRKNINRLIDFLNHKD